MEFTLDGVETKCMIWSMHFQNGVSVGSKREESFYTNTYKMNVVVRAVRSPYQTKWWVKGTKLLYSMSREITLEFTLLVCIICILILKLQVWAVTVVRFHA